MRILNLIIVCTTITLMSSCSQESEQVQSNINDDYLFKRQTDALEKAKAMEKEIQQLQAQRRKNIEEQLN